MAGLALALGLGVRRSGRRGPVYDADALALFAAMTSEPDAARKVAINNLVVALKDGAIWPYLDLLYLTAAHNAQAARLNWLSSSTYTLTPQNSPAFTADRGYQADGSTSYLDSGYLPATNGVNWQVSDASVWSWSRTDLSSDVPDVGAGTAYIGTVIPRAVSGNMGGALNRVGTNSAAAVATSLGLSGISRSSGATERMWRNGVQQGADFAQASVGRPSGSFRIGGRSPNVYSARQVSFAAAGGSLAGKEAAFYSAINTYMQAVGAA